MQVPQVMFHPKKNIESQRRLFSTTKSSKKASAISIRNPTIQESQNIVISLILNKTQECKKQEFEEISENMCNMKLTS